MRVLNTVCEIPYFVILFDMEFLPEKAFPPSLFAPLKPEARRLMDGIPALIDKTFPLPGRFRSALPGNVAELSRLLTSGRGERGLSYLGRPEMLSAYLRYFLPWNLYRLCRLLPGLEINPVANDRVTDLGCGPLTFAAALWICRPDLRLLPLEFYCIDRSGPALEAGKKFFTALAGEKSPWKIHVIRDDIGNAKTQPAALVCAVNVFNEMHGDISRGGPGGLQRNAEKSVRLLENYATADASILIAEPGFPRCGELISLMRKAFIESSRGIISPCPHEKDCPFPGGQNKRGKERWCHFAFETNDAPSALHKLSLAARLPKERAVLSFFFCGRKKGSAAMPQLGSGVRQCRNGERGCGNAAMGNKTAMYTPARVISDAFTLPYNRYGRYCCSEQGTILLEGEKSKIEKTASGAFVNVICKKDKKDAKSGVLMAEFP